MTTPPSSDQTPTPQPPAPAPAPSPYGPTDQPPHGWAAPSPAPRRGGLSAAGIVGVAVGTVLVVGLVWGVPATLVVSGLVVASQSLADDAAGGSPSDEPSDEATTPPSATLVGDLPLDRNSTSTAEPQLVATLSDRWEEQDADPGFRLFYDTDTYCALTIDEGGPAGGVAGESDASATAELLDLYVQSMKDDTDNLSDVTEEPARTTVWVDANDGRGRVEFQQSRSRYTVTDGGDEWESIMVGRVLTAPAWGVYAYVDCPTSTAPADIASATDDAFAGLVLRG